MCLCTSVCRCVCVCVGVCVSVCRCVCIGVCVGDDDDDDDVMNVSSPFRVRFSLSKEETFGRPPSLSLLLRFFRLFFGRRNTVEPRWMRQLNSDTRVEEKRRPSPNDSTWSCRRGEEGREKRIFFLKALRKGKPRPEKDWGSRGRRDFQQCCLSEGFWH